MRTALICVLLGAAVAPSLAQDAAQVLNRRFFHLRSGSQPEWEEFATSPPDGTGLSLQFEAKPNPEEATLLVEQDNVKLDWAVEVNGKKVGNLFLMEAPLVQTLRLPAGVLRNGENTVAVIPPKENDDILVGEIAIIHRPLAEVLSLQQLAVEVIDKETGKPIPCRITIVDQGRRLTPLSALGEPKLAVRPGVVYTPNGRAILGILPGVYTVYATRGFEYGLGQASAQVKAGQTNAVRLQIGREVPTPGLVACDTHIHTFTYARHGDATIDERAITLAGEGIELPISTEHDQLIDLAGAAGRMGVEHWFTPVIGDEVTTAKGHFNIFPVSFNAQPPNNKEVDWPRLMESFRATAGVEVIVLNHPRNVHSGFQPFASTNFNAVTGTNRRGFNFTFDAIEIANSSALQSDWRASIRDWFALLNHGSRFTAVGSSDVHDVSRYIVGQGRTYIACADDDPARIDIMEACRNLRQGHALVSLGLLATLTLDSRFSAGDLATGLGPQMHVAVRVLGPSWVEANRVELYANGTKIREETIRAERRTGTAQPGRTDLEIAWEIPRPSHDVYLVALASGPGVSAPYWAIARPYQPSSPTWDPHVLGVTNPIWVDADADGKFTSARDYAKQIIQTKGKESQQLLATLGSFDEAIAAQLAELYQSSGADVQSAAFEAALARAPERIRLAFESGLTSPKSGHP